MSVAVLTIGPITFHWYGIIIGFSILIGYLLTSLRAKSYQISQNVIDTLFLLTLPAGIIGARVYHVLDYFEYYQQNSIQILFIWQGGLGIYGGLLAALVVIYKFAKFKKLSVLKLLDLASPAVALAQSVGRWGNFVNYEAFGPPANLPWAISIPEEVRPTQFQTFEKFHPAFLYESVASFLIFIILMVAAAKVRQKPGFVFALYVMLYSITRLLVENFRLNTWVIANFKVAQIISFGLLIYSLILLTILFKRAKV